MNYKRKIFLIMAMLMAVHFGISCGDGGGPIEVTAKIVLQDGTQKELTATPLPLFLKIQITFPNAVDPALAQPLFSLKKGNKTVATTITWNGDYTVMTVKPNDLLDYQATYTVEVAAGAVTAMTVAGRGKAANVAAFSGTFATMVQNDVNGDGYADPVLSAPLWEAGGGTGRIYLFYGMGLSGSLSATSADAIVTGEAAGNGFYTVFTTGTLDYNADGYADLYGNAFSYNTNRGRDYAFLGGAGETPISGGIGAASANYIWTGVNDNDRLSLHGVNDVNGDGYADLIGSAVCPNNTGCGYVFFGPNFESEPASGADVILTGVNNDDTFAVTGISTADFNGDGVADLVSSAPGADSDNGRIYVFNGGSGLASGSVSSANTIITGEGGSFIMNSLGDLNGDGRQDILAVAPGYDASRGRTYIFYSSNLANEAATDADAIFTGENVGDEFGEGFAFTRASFIADVSGDGTNDVILSARKYSGEAGRIYVFLGDSGFASKGAAEADVIFTGQAAGDRLRASAVGDVNGDGIDDVIASMDQYAVTAARKVYIFYGGSGLASKNAASADVIITAENLSDGFYTEFCLDVNGDGIDDLISRALGYNANTGRNYMIYGGSGLTNKGAADADVIVTGENAGDIFGI